MDDVHGFGGKLAITKFVDELRSHFKLKGGEPLGVGVTCWHLKRFRQKQLWKKLIWPNPKYAVQVAEQKSHHSYQLSHLAQIFFHASYGQARLEQS